MVSMKVKGHRDRLVAWHWALYRHEYMLVSFFLGACLGQIDSTPRKVGHAQTTVSTENLTGSLDLPLQSPSPRMLSWPQFTQL